MALLTLADLTVETVVSAAVTVGAVFVVAVEFVVDRAAAVVEIAVG